MFRPLQRWSVGIYFLALGVCVPSADAQPSERGQGQPSSAWTKGDVWALQIEQFPSEKNAPPRKYTVRAVVTGKDNVDDVECWRVSFIPQTDVPAELAFTYYLSIG